VLGIEDINSLEIWKFSTDKNLVVLNNGKYRIDCRLLDVGFVHMTHLRCGGFDVPVFGKDCSCREVMIAKELIQTKGSQLFRGSEAGKNLLIERLTHSLLKYLY